MAKILIVDDRPENREFLVALLGYRRHELLEAADGAEALALVRAQRPALVITDILMPTMDGYEFVRQLRSDPAIAATTVIFCTADYRGREARRLAESCGVVHLLMKPCEPELVLRVVDEALGLGSTAPTPAPPESDFDREHLRLLTDKLSEKAAELHSANQRLAELVDVNLQLAAENNSHHLLQKVCGSARTLTGAKYAAVGVGDKEKPDGPGYFVTSGIDAETAERLRTPALREGMLGTLLVKGRPFRLSRLQGGWRAAGFPVEHPLVHCFLAAPIISPSHAYGWLCLTDKLGAEEFSEEDERLTALLAAHVGRLYENRTLYADIESYTLELEREVGERRKADQQLRRLNEELDQRIAQRTAELEAANKELEAFAYSVSHDLRAPLRAVTGFSTILAREFATQMPEEARELLGRAIVNAKRMEQLITDLLRFSQLAWQPLSKGTVDIARLVSEVLEELGKDLQERVLDVRLGDLPEAIGDAAMLRQVFVNLLSNAFKFTRRTERPIVEVGSRRQHQEIVYFVRDNGAGFDMHYADKLFGVFQRLHRADEFEGTGVGLSLVQRIIHRHGGRVWAEAKVDAGATIYFSLPD